MLFKLIYTRVFFAPISYKTRNRKLVFFIIIRRASIIWAESKKQILVSELLLLGIYKTE